MNGKGDTPRPLSISQNQFSDNWEKIFGKKEKMCEYSGLPNTETYEGKSKKVVDELTEFSQEIGLYDASERNEDNKREFPRIDEDGNPIEWTAC